LRSWQSGIVKSGKNIWKLWKEKNCKDERRGSKKPNERELTPQFHTVFLRRVSATAGKRKTELKIKNNRKKRSFLYNLIKAKSWGKQNGRGRWLLWALRQTGMRRENRGEWGTTRKRFHDTRNSQSRKSCEMKVGGIPTGRGP